MAQRFEFDPREVEQFLKPLKPREELVYRTAIAGLCERCRGDRVFRARLDALRLRFRGQLAEILREATVLSDEWTQGK